MAGWVGQELITALHSTSRSSREKLTCDFSVELRITAQAMYRRGEWKLADESRGPLGRGTTFLPPLLRRMIRTLASHKRSFSTDSTWESKIRGLMAASTTNPMRERIARQNLETGGSRNASSPSSKSWSALGVADGTRIHRKTIFAKTQVLSFDNRTQRSRTVWYAWFL